MQQPVNTNDTYGSLFGATLDLKNDLMGQHVAYMNAGVQQQPQSLPAILTSALMSGNGSAAMTSHSAMTNSASGQQHSSQCMTSTPTPTPTIYTIEDHGGGTPLITLAGGAGPAANAASASATAAGHKKRKLSLTDTFPINSAAAANSNGSNKSMNVKQEPRKLVTLMISTRGCSLKKSSYTPQKKIRKNPQNPWIFF